MKITQGPPCRTTKLGPGETYVEIPEHPVLATAKRTAKWTATFLLPADKPLFTPTDDPCRADDDDHDDHDDDHDDDDHDDDDDDKGR